MLSALPLALAQLGDRRILAVLARSLLLALLVFALLGGLIGYLLSGTDPCALIEGWHCVIAPGESGLVALLLTLAGLWFLFPAVAMGTLSLFSDEVVEAVEARHYPRAAAQGRRPGWGIAARLGLASAGRLIAYNLAALPFYLLLLVTGIGPFLLFLAVNAVALGRDLGEMVAVRHLDRRERKAWLAASRGSRALLGLVITGLFMIPVANLLAPVLGAAMATHIFHGRKR